MSVFGTSRSHFGHQRFCWMRVWHSPCSWLKLSVAPASVAGNTLIGMLTRLILRYPFHVGRAAIKPLFLDEKCLVHVDLKLPEPAVFSDALHAGAVPIPVILPHLD